MPAFEPCGTWNPKVNRPEALGAASASGLMYASPAQRLFSYDFHARHMIDNPWQSQHVIGGRERELLLDAVGATPRDSQIRLAWWTKTAWGDGSQHVLHVVQQAERQVALNPMHGDCLLTGLR